jgi:hypothetical protein
MILSYISSGFIKTRHMKKALLFTLALISSWATFAQNDIYKYHFKDNLNEMYSKGAALTAQCTGTYGTETLPVGVTKKTYRFDKGCGLVYNDATKNFIASGSYTIELYFRLDTIAGYKKLVDFDSMKQDPGIYNQTGRIVLYPSFTSVDSFIGAGVWQYLAITRNGSNKYMYINAKGKSAGTYIDVADQYKLGVNKLLTFFRDDKTTNGEQSKGAVAMIQISNYAIDSNTIKSNYLLLNKTLNVPGTTANANEIVIYPNPTTGSMHVTAVANCNFSICDITGKIISTGILQQGDNNITLEFLSTGLYLLKMVSSDGTELRAYKFSKL